MTTGSGNPWVPVGEENRGLTPSESERYSRQILMTDWGASRQEKLKHATVFIAGAGGLGSPAAMYLAGAGIGRLVVCDKDTVDLSNLNRQILYGDENIRTPKAEAAKQALTAINGDIRVESVHAGIDGDNALALLGEADIIVDCLDNLETRLILGRAAVTRNIPMVYGAVWGLEGRLTFLHSPETPCMACIATEPPASETFPAVGPVTGVIGSMQALEVVKYLTGTGEILKNRLLVWDGYLNRMRMFNIKKRSGCDGCDGKDGPAFRDGEMM